MTADQSPVFVVSLSASFCRENPLLDNSLRMVGLPQGALHQALDRAQRLLTAGTQRRIIAYRRLDFQFFFLSQKSNRN